MPFTPPDCVIYAILLSHLFYKKKKPKVVLAIALLPPKKMPQNNNNENYYGWLHYHIKNYNIIDKPIIYGSMILRHGVWNNGMLRKNAY